MDRRSNWLGYVAIGLGVLALMLALGDRGRAERVTIWGPGIEVAPPAAVAPAPAAPRAQQAPDVQPAVPPHGLEGREFFWKHREAHGRHFGPGWGGRFGHGPFWGPLGFIGELVSGLVKGLAALALILLGLRLLRRRRDGGQGGPAGPPPPSDLPPSDAPRPAGYGPHTGETRYL